MQDKVCNFPLHNDDLVTVTISGKVIDITYSQKRSRGGHIKTLSKDLYMDSEGIVYEFKHNNTRADDLDNVRKSMAYARCVINANCMHPERLRWLTLTYAENMQDVQRLYVDLKRFIVKMRKFYGHFEYIAAVEPQGRGAWHCHCIMIFPDVAPFLENRQVADLWGQGFINVKAVADVDNIGAYLSAYMADVEVEAGAEATGAIVERTVEGQIKRFIKGARLSMYPKGIHIYRYSRGLKKPETIVCRYDKALTIAEELGTSKHYEALSSIVSDDFYNLIKKEQWK